MRDAYFACDPCDARSVADALTGAARASEAGGARWFALVDTAFDHGRPRMPWPRPVLPLYGPGRLAVLSGVSPWLCELAPAGGESLRLDAGRLAMHAGDRPMLAFLETSLPAHALAHRLSASLEVRTDDGQVFLLRLADTRVSAVLPQALDAGNWRHVARGIGQWLIVGREGHLQPLALPQPVDSAGEPDTPLQLAPSELERLLEAGMPDALVQAMHEHFAELLPAEGRAALHAQVADICALARRHRIDQFPQCFALAVALLSTQGALRHDPRFEAWLRQRRWTDDTFQDSLAELVGEVAP